MAGAEFEPLYHAGQHQRSHEKSGTHGQQKLAEKADRNALDVFNDIVAVTNAATKKKDYKNALKGLELQGKHLGMFTERINLTGNLDLAVAIEEGRKRVGSRS